MPADSHEVQWRGSSVDAIGFDRHEIPELALLSGTEVSAPVLRSTTWMVPSWAGYA